MKSNILYKYFLLVILFFQIQLGLSQNIAIKFEPLEPIFNRYSVTLEYSPFDNQSFILNYNRINIDKTQVTPLLVTNSISDKKIEGGQFDFSYRRYFWQKTRMHGAFLEGGLGIGNYYLERKTSSNSFFLISLGDESDSYSGKTIDLFGKVGYQFVLPIGVIFDLGLGFSNKYLTEEKNDPLFIFHGFEGILPRMILELGTDFKIIITQALNTKDKWSFSPRVQYLILCPRFKRKPIKKE